jgi:stage II sporulation protein D
MNRWFALLCVAAALVAGPAALAQGPAPKVNLDGEPSFEVGLAWDLDSLFLIPSRELSLVASSGGRDRPFPSTRQPLRIVRSADSARVTGSGVSFSFSRAETLWIAGDDPRMPTMRWNGKTWRGMAKVFFSPRAKLTLALKLPLETYLCGVLPGEIGGLDAAAMEAGRAQAVAARSYTLFYRGRRGTEGFDVYGTVEDQVYGPIESERELATKCVSETRGLVALWQNTPIRANYCSTCGGITAEVWEAWPAPALPYLVSHRDNGSSPDHCAKSPQYRWQESWSAAEFISNIERFAPLQNVALPAGMLGGLEDVVVRSRSHSGRVWQLEVRTRAGSVMIPAYSIRQVLRRGGKPDAILRSNLFKIDVRRDPVTRKAIQVVANGAGSGHGVGLCQTGALGMSRAGKKGEEILRHYYPGAKLEHLY